MTVSLRRFFVLALAFHAAPARAADDPAVQKTLKTLVNAIRYGKYDLASKQLAYDEMAKSLMEDTWAAMSEAERKEMSAGLQTLIEKRSFVKANEQFKYLDALLFDPVRKDASTLRCKSTIVIHRSMKKTEIVIDWVLAQVGGAWRVLDTYMAGESTLGSIREDEVQPIIKEGGLPAVMKALRAKVAEAKES